MVININMILLQQVVTDTANTPVTNWTAIGVIIAAGVLIVTIVFAVIGRAFKLNAKVTRVETKVDVLTDTVSTLGANLENFKLNVINLIARGSPSYLTKEGVEIAKNTGVAKLVEDHYKEILSVVRDTEPANAYRAQEALLSAVRNLQYDDECRNVLETAAYESGYPISTIYTIGGYYIRDRVINELGFSKDDIDKHDPEQNEKKPK